VHDEREADGQNGGRHGLTCRTATAPLVQRIRQALNGSAMRTCKYTPIRQVRERLMFIELAATPLVVASEHLAIAVTALNALFGLTCALFAHVLGFAAQALRHARVGLFHGIHGCL
jgi:hypothetical protein